METMRYHEKKKSAKIPIIVITLFLLIGGIIIIFAISTEKDPIVLGEDLTEVQSLMNTTDNEVNIYQDLESVDIYNIQYEVTNKYLTDKSYVKFKSNMTLPIIYIGGEELADLNSQIVKKYSDMYSTLKTQMSGELKDSQYKYTYTVTYKKYENTIAGRKILSITIYERIVDDTAKKNSMEAINSYNIDLSTKKDLSQSDLMVDFLGADYKNIIKNQVKQYVVDSKYISEADYKYTCTGLEKFYFKDGKLNILFNAGDIVDQKYSILDITINK